MTTLTREEVLRMAAEVGSMAIDRGNKDCAFVFYITELEKFAALCIAEGERRERVKSVPECVLSLVRFMCGTWLEIENWAYANCNSEALGKYPVIQGTSFQIKLIRISEQSFRKDDVYDAIKYVLENPERAAPPARV